MLKSHTTIPAPLPPALNRAGSGTLVKRQASTPDVVERTKDAKRRAPPGPRDVFICSEESHFYSQCLEKFMLGSGASLCETVMEFGAGDGSPVINCLTGRSFDGVVHGFEINPQAAALARLTAARHGLGEKYQIHGSCFFKAAESMGASTLIANPPYIPAPDNKIMMPALHGGTDGAQLTRGLMELGFQNLILMIASYSNPVETLQHARAQGYALTNFLVTPLPFGTYSSEPKVKDWIAQMKREGLAFYSGSFYLLAGVLLQKVSERQPAAADMTDGLLALMTALK